MKNSKVKGSVLYTVISVMMIVTVLIFAALALASSSGKRAVNTYADKQTQFTARSVVESIYKSLETNSDFSSSFSSIPKHSSRNISVSLPDSGLGSVVKATVTNVGNGNEFGYNSEKPIYKISANVSLNGKENTVAMYILADYEKRTSPYLYSVSALDSISMNNLKIFGGAASNVSGKSLVLKEDLDFNGFYGINGDLKLTSSSQINFLSPGTGMYVNGNLTIEDTGEKLLSQVNEMAAYEDIPYIYVEDHLYLGGGNGFSAGRSDSPFILYSGTVSNYGNNSIYGDIYLLDEHKLKGNVEYGLSEFFVNEMNNGSFYPWKDGLIKKVNGNGSSYLGGNIYSKGKILVRGTSSDNGYILANDVVSSELEISAAKVSVNGSAVILNNLFFSGLDKGEYYFKKGLFVDPDKLKIECSDIIINNVRNNLSGETEFIKEINAYSFFINGGVIYIDNTDQSIKIEMLDESGNICADSTQVVSIRVSSALLSGENEKAITYIEDKKYNYQKEYKKFLKDIVHNYGNMFPSSMDREYLKGSKLADNNMLESDSVLNIMNNSKSSSDINSTVNFNALPLYYINFGSLYKNYKNSIGEVVIERAALNDESKPITDSCTLIGDFQNGTMYIDPGDKEIWIRLINFHGQSGFKIIINDSGTGKVNFFVPGAGEFIEYFRTNKDKITVNIQNFEWWSDFVYSDGNIKLEDTCILTKTYADYFTGGTFEIMKNPNLLNERERKMIPNINVYMDTEFDGDFKFMGESAITGYVMAPTAYLAQSGISPLLNIKYNSNNYMPLNTGFIGSVIFKEIDAKNALGFVYVNPNSALDSTPEQEIPVKFTVLYYQCY